MPRKKKIDSEKLIKYAERYIIEDLEGNINQYKIPGFGKYLRNNGIDIEDYLIRRNNELKTHISELKSKNEEFHLKNVSVYKGLDFDAFIKVNNNKTSLMKAVQQRDKYYKDISESAAYCFNEYQKIKDNNINLEKDNNDLKKENQNYNELITILKKENSRLNKEVKILRNIVDTYVYPEIANELLVKNGILKQTSEIIDIEEVDKHIISASTNVDEFISSAINDLMEVFDD